MSFNQSSCEVFSAFELPPNYPISFDFAASLRLSTVSSCLLYKFFIISDFCLSIRVLPSRCYTCNTSDFLLCMRDTRGNFGPFHIKKYDVLCESFGQRNIKTGPRTPESTPGSLIMFVGCLDKILSKCKPKIGSGDIGL